MRDRFMGAIHSTNFRFCWYLLTLVLRGCLTYKDVEQLCASPSAFRVWRSYSWVRFMVPTLVTCLLWSCMTDGLIK